MTVASPASPPGPVSIGPHWWNGPRAQDDEVSPASAMMPGNWGSCPNTSSCQAVCGSPPRTSRWKPTPYTAFRMVSSAPVRLVFGSFHVPPISSSRSSSSSWRR